MSEGRGSGAGGPPGRDPSSRRWRFPAEWELHRATWLAWPHKEASWPGRLEHIPPLFAAMVSALATGERVEILVRDDADAASIGALLDRAGVAAEAVGLHHIPTDDAWIRDHGPIFVVRDAPPALAAVDWGYNAWGGKYPPWDQDAEVARRVASLIGVPRIEGGMVLEGGSIDTDGEGTLLTTESCLLHPNRNPGLSRGEIEERLRAGLGVERILWLGDGIVGDDTDGHVDDLTRFVAPGVVVTAVEDDPADANYAALADNARRLEGMVDARGRRLTVLSLPMPAPVLWEGHRLPASYANFYVANAVVLLPVFGDPNDARAVDVLARAFPGRRVVPIPARDLVWGLGACHCLTQQEPAVGRRIRAASDP
jgi:agmatine deiminase